MPVDARMRGQTLTGVQCIQAAIAFLCSDASRVACSIRSALGSFRAKCGGMKSLRSARSFLTLAALSAAACGDSSASTEDEIRDLNATTVSVVEAGDGWQRIHVRTSTLIDNQRVPLDQILIVAEGTAGLKKAPLEASIRDLFLSAGSDADPSRTIVVSATQVEALKRAASDNVVQKEGSVGVVQQPLCQSREERRTFRKEFVLRDQTVTDERARSEGAWRGDISVSANVRATATAEVDYATEVSCGIPIGVSILGTRLRAEASASMQSRASGAVTRGERRQARLATVDLGSVTFTVGPIPVVLGLRAPIDVGVDVDASASVELATHLVARATIDAECARDAECVVSPSGSVESTVTSGKDALRFEGRGSVQIEPWLQVSLRSYLYSEKVDAVQLGLRAGVRASAWGYAGNDCGDRDGDGVSETVLGGAVDISAPVVVNAQAELLGKARWKKSWPVANKHLSFVPLDTAAFKPIFFQEESSGAQETWRVGLGGCLPYRDTVTFEVDWRDGERTTAKATPGKTAAVSHTYRSAKHEAPVIVAATDAAGRRFL